MASLRPSPLPLARETSLYIDAMRVLAALVVFLDHFARPSVSGGLFWQVAPFGGDAVIVFFVISGFVIAHATAQKERNAADYFISRAARIYSVAVPAIVLTIACDFVGQWIDPRYTNSWFSGDTEQSLSHGHNPFRAAKVARPFCPSNHNGRFLTASRI